MRELSAIDVSGKAKALELDGDVMELGEGRGLPEYDDPLSATPPLVEVRSEIVGLRWFLDVPTRKDNEERGGFDLSLVFKNRAESLRVVAIREGDG
jgi:hypothetical protein